MVIFFSCSPAVVGRSAGHGPRPFYRIALSTLTPGGSGSANGFLSVTIISGSNRSTSGNCFIPGTLFNCCISCHRTVSIAVGTQSTGPANCSIVSSWG